MRHLHTHMHAFIAHTSGAGTYMHAYMYTRDLAHVSPLHTLTHTQGPIIQPSGVILVLDTIGGRGYYCG